MNGLERRVRRRKSFKERLGFVGIGCCGGAAWSSNMSTREEEEGELDLQEIPAENGVVDQACADQIPGEEAAVVVPSAMNLATALAAERQFRAEGDMVEPTDGESNCTPLRVSLKRLLEEGDGGVADEKKGGGEDGVCCVCMGRRKGAAFIPCGHTFCRVCSRELWLNRGSCPICNRSIVEILDIF